MQSSHKLHVDHICQNPPQIRGQMTAHVRDQIITLICNTVITTDGSARMN